MNKLWIIEIGWQQPVIFATLCLHVHPEKVLELQVQDPMFTMIRLLLSLHIYIISLKDHISKSSSIINKTTINLLQK